MYNGVQVVVVEGGFLAYHIHDRTKNTHPEYLNRIKTDLWTTWLNTFEH